MDEISRCCHLNEIPLAEVLLSTIWILGFYKNKFKFLEEFLFGHYQAWNGQFSPQVRQEKIAKMAIINLLKVAR